MKVTFYVHGCFVTFENCIRCENCRLDLFWCWFQAVCGLIIEDEDRIVLVVREIDV